MKYIVFNEEILRSIKKDSSLEDDQVFLMN